MSVAPLDLGPTVETFARATPTKMRRSYDDKIVHYAMTTYFLTATTSDPQRLSDEACRHLTACLDPSVIDLDDTPFTADLVTTDESLAAHLADFDDRMERVQERMSDYPDYDTSSATAVFASWSSVVVLGDTDEETTYLMAALQARVQISWLAAWTIQDISSRVLHSSRKGISRVSLDWQAVELNRLKRYARARVDSSESDRIARLLECFETTSGLTREWNLAEEALEDAREYAEVANARGAESRQLTIEALLLLFSLASFAPMFLELPLTGWSDVREQWQMCVTLLILLGIGLAAVFRRDR
ncbi:MAG: hypothetical protein QM597_08655 [Aeromicrobium sp.]|uniref:hypothetical protein n=1 Tax=Aeromicrobium sp. TaxID=1871063 RepID=UPI0039E5CDE8